MFANILSNMRQKKELARLSQIVEEIHSHESKIKSLSENDIIRKTEELKSKALEKYKENEELLKELNAKIDMASGAEEKGRIKKEAKNLYNEMLSDILPEAFALVKEACRRMVGKRWNVSDIEIQWDMVPFDVQLMGGIVLHEGKIAEMATGEGKTLVATMPAYLNALLGRGVHIVTVNDYLARRDREWMGPVYESLGLTVGVIQSHMDPPARKQAYTCDITYGTNNEFGFDYLRDNISVRKEDIVQRNLHYAIIDEVDSILVDEARTPLIISGPTDDSVEMYLKIDRIVRRLRKGADYEVDEKAHTVTLTEDGIEKAQQLLGIDSLYDTANMGFAGCIQQSLRAHELFHEDKDYLIKDGQVLIVDEFTGRLLPGRRYSEGLHQALEAKSINEGKQVTIERENQTLATITFQNYFRLYYEKYAGMTGTAKTEEDEFKRVYDLEVVSIPTNKPLRRTEMPDVIYKTRKEMLSAVTREIKDLHEQGRPVLVGTISIQSSEEVSKHLKEEGIEHEVLNAKYHEKEAKIVANAGQKSTVTIATQMAGRGTDIKLGVGVAEIGGLHILGVERHEDRRIDNQLRGRSGRQGDPGSSQFFLSLEDDLLRIFGGDRIKSLMGRFGLPDNEPIVHPWLTRTIEGAQKRVEEQNFEIRRNLLSFDDVMDRQREVIYKERRKALEEENLKEIILHMMDDVIDNEISFYAPENVHPEDWDLDDLRKFVSSHFSIHFPGVDTNRINTKELKRILKEKIQETYAAKEREISEEIMRHLEKIILLQTIDRCWKEHLRDMDELRQGIGLRGYGGTNPLVEYKKEAYEMFGALNYRIEKEISNYLFKVKITEERKPENVLASDRMRFLHPDAASPRRNATASNQMPDTQINRPQTDEKITPFRRAQPKVGRNDPCPCGSGKKYKKCCGKNI
ncbi:MAG: preprotein translocase subunit SecA [Candidatus Ratteibacteria bacterium]|nr:preprotein translocase subunit SecA [Candidatus Ratteibacteria bacterium]